MHLLIKKMKNIPKQNNNSQEQEGHLKEIERLKNIFNLYKEMYQLPGMAMEDVEKIFMEKYLPSVKKFDNKIEERELEKIQEQNLANAHRKKELVASIIESSLQNLKSIMLKGDDLQKRIIATNIDILDGAPSVKDILELIELGLDENQSLSVRLAFLNIETILEETVIFGKDAREFVEEKINPLLDILEEEMSPYYYWQYIFIILGRSINEFKQETVNSLKNIYNDRDTPKNLKMLILRCLLVNKQKNSYQNEENIKEYISWYENEFNFSLYQDQVFNVDLLKGEMGKDGGRLILLGKGLEQKVVSRIMDIEAFQQWRKAYENPEIWKEADFDYVPVEPILSFDNMKDGKVRASVGVLGMTLSDYARIFPEEKSKKLFQQAQEIRKILEKININYTKTHNESHWHDNNFCLKFERTPEGEIDLKKLPRLYLIDWDHAGQNK